MIELAVLGFGSNLGRRLSNIRNALKLLSDSPSFNLLRISSVYETSPWGFKQQNNFLNCVAAGLWHSKCTELFNETREIEKNLGRKKEKKWRPRIIDIDILFFGNKKVKRKNLTVPHPGIPFRNFVLE